MTDAAQETRINGAKTGRNEDGTFAAGNPGRPLGARHKTTVAVETILEGDAENLTRKAVEMALGGDGMALRLCLDRLVPVRKSRPIKLALPKIEKAADVASAMSALVQAVTEGDIDTDEGTALAGIIEIKRRSIETVDIEQRLAALEKGRRK